MALLWPTFLGYTAVHFHYEYEDQAEAADSERKRILKRCQLTQLPSIFNAFLSFLMCAFFYWFLDQQGTNK